MNTAEITHHPAGPVDGSGRERPAEWRLWIPGYPTQHFPHDGSEHGMREAHERAMDAAAKVLGELQ